MVNVLNKRYTEHYHAKYWTLLREILKIITIIRTLLLTCCSNCSFEICRTGIFGFCVLIYKQPQPWITINLDDKCGYFRFVWIKIDITPDWRRIRLYLNDVYVVSRWRRRSRIIFPATYHGRSLAINFAYCWYFDISIRSRETVNIVTHLKIFLFKIRLSR